MSTDDHLIIFIKNPVLGKVKTRIAATTGDEVALNIYNQLLLLTMHNTVGLDLIEKHLYYSDKIELNDQWSSNIYQKKVQVQGDLGHKMKQAFKCVFDTSKEPRRSKVVIIGSDCPEVSEELLLRAFDLLDQYDVVLGPTFDGGYYLLGMNKYLPVLFEDIAWSTDSVYSQTVQKLLKGKLTFGHLPTLYDMDTEEDWIAYQARISITKV